MSRHHSPQNNATGEQAVLSFNDLLAAFEAQFNDRLFPKNPATLYEAVEYSLSNGGKRIRPILCLMANNLMGPVHLDAFLAANAVELYHNFTLVHDDIMDHAPLRRGQPTVYKKFNTNTAILTGDTLLLYVFEYLNCIQGDYKQAVTATFLEAALAVGEGQQTDLDMEAMPLSAISYTDYLDMITMKTAVLLAASLQIGGMIGGAGEEDQEHLYAFGKNIGTAFQIQDDYLDCFGDQVKFGKQICGDILLNKKTFLLLKTFESATPAQRSHLEELMADNTIYKIAPMVQLYKDCKADQWAIHECQRYQDIALRHLKSISVPEAHKQALLSLTDMLLNRAH